MKIEYQQRDKLKNTAILFPLTSDNLQQMIYTCKIINKRYKRCDYVCAYTSSIKNLDKIFNVNVKLNGENTFINIVKGFIKSCSYRKVLIVCNDVIFDTGSGLTIRLPIEIPRKGMWFDMYNVNILNLTSSQRKSANRAYQTCKHTCFYLDIGKEKSKTRERIIKKFDKIDDNIDNFLIIKKKVLLLECKNEKINDYEKIYKKYKKEFDNFKNLNEIILPKTIKIGSYGIELSKKRDYSIVDDRIKEQLKIQQQKLQQQQKKTKKSFPSKKISQQKLQISSKKYKKK